MNVKVKVCKDCSKEFDCPSVWRRTQRCPACSKIEENRRNKLRKQAHNTVKDLTRCEKCGRTDGVIAHHIKPLCTGGDNENNVMALCPWCHIEEHRTGWIARAS